MFLRGGDKISDITSAHVNTIQHEEPRFISIASDSSKDLSASRSDVSSRIYASFQEWGAVFGLGTEGSDSVKSAGDSFYEDENYQQALEQYKKALGMIRSQMEKVGERGEMVYRQGTDLADTHVAIGLCLQKHKPGKTREIPHFVKAMKMYRVLLDGSKRIDEMHASTISLKMINLWNLIGNANFDTGKYSLAMKNYKIAMKEAQDLLKPKRGKEFEKKLRVQKANTMINIANVYAAQNERQESMKYYNRGLEMQMAILKESDPVVAVTLHNMGTNYFQSGQYELALKAYRQVLKIQRDASKYDRANIPNVRLDIALVKDRLKAKKEAAAAT